MMKILTVLGARPQFIKAAALSAEIAKHKDVQEIIIHTGQHFDANMSAVFFEQMGIPKPDYNLNINSLSHGAMTGRMLEKIEELIIKEKPDWVAVYGDTNSTIAGALAAKKLHVKVAHIEAGLRSFDMKMPEEINRILTDQISDVLFCPTDTAVQNLINEGFLNKPVKIIKSGDIMFDSVLLFKQKMKVPEFEVPEKFVLTTVHRQENTDNLKRLKKIVQALNRLHEEGQHIILPLHPRTRNILKKENIALRFEPVSPVGYLEMLNLLEHTQFVITDSGGLQKEAYFFGKYCVTLRDSTEWVELVKHGFNTLIDFDGDIYTQIKKVVQTKVSLQNRLYGNGNTAKIIVNELKKHNV